MLMRMLPWCKCGPKLEKCNPLSSLNLQEFNTVSPLPFSVFSVSSFSASPWVFCSLLSLLRLLEHPLVFFLLVWLLKMNLKSCAASPWVLRSLLNLFQHPLEPQRFRSGCRWVPEWHFQGEFSSPRSRSSQSLSKLYKKNNHTGHSHCNSTFLSILKDPASSRRSTNIVNSHWNNRYSEHPEGNSVFLCEQWAVWAWVSSGERRSGPALPLVVPGAFFAGPRYTSTLHWKCSWYFWYLEDSLPQLM